MDVIGVRNVAGESLGVETLTVACPTRMYTLPLVSFADRWMPEGEIPSPRVSCRCLPILQLNVSGTRSSVQENWTSEVAIVLQYFIWRKDTRHLNETYLLTRCAT